MGFFGLWMSSCFSNIVLPLVDYFQPFVKDQVGLVTVGEGVNIRTPHMVFADTAGGSHCLPPPTPYCPVETTGPAPILAFSDAPIPAEGLGHLDLA